MTITLFLILGLIPCVLADDWEDFTNNLATDLVSGNLMQKRLSVNEAFSLFSLFSLFRLDWCWYANY